ncbi:carbonic anhydrase [Novosphingobium sp. 1949]|uniref:Carbonic anhydrase n=1 Tax=Novosphingobium organovorum TaxID=2930092 RepID=A0ABT0B8R7_9SPHN|nr:carbonic anhydrase [Novosphingobium organovorum]MCJ2181423.1 carbonic anhydrase [Novosphingobium organovorum]
MSETLSPVLDGLIDGYRRFRSTGWTPHRERWAKLKDGQEPQVMVISCSDSRVDPTQIFDVDPGEIFVVRNVAALVPPYETTPGHHGVSAALEFAVQVLGVKEVVVMGHGMCGGCKAALSQSVKDKEPGAGGFVANWIALLDEAREAVVHEHGTTGRPAEIQMEQAGVRVSLANLMTFPWVREKVESGELTLRGTFFAISDGVLHLMDKETGAFEPIT